MDSYVRNIHIDIDSTEWRLNYHFIYHCNELLLCVVLESSTGLVKHTALCCIYCIYFFVYNFIKKTR
jgi:hypothetical protein